MTPSPRLEQTLKTVQQMILSPQMQQAIQILQMPIMELRAKIAQEMEGNPLLEERIESSVSLDETVSAVNNTNSIDSDGQDTEFRQEFDRLADLDDEWKDYFRQSNFNKKSSAVDEEKRRYMEASISFSESLHEHLIQQLNMMTLDTVSYKIGEYIIGCIDSNGYLHIPVEQIALTLNCPEEDAERMLSRIQTFNPIGVGARDLKECLFLQLNASSFVPKYVRSMIENHMEDMARHKYQQIAKALKADVEDIQDSAAFISKMEPKPGRIFGQDTVTYITPDIFIEEREGDYEIILNDDRIPHLHISNLYKNAMNNEETPEDTRDYIKTKVRSGMWLIKNIQQRQQTIYNIMRKIIDLQKFFFKEGVGHLEPMTMQEIAAQIGIHESTVSRAVSKKYVQTPHGLFPVKYFFSNEMKTSDGGITSARNIKQSILNIIQNEDSKNPLSDQDIITLLKKEGIPLARRTVAKYRKELKIPSSNLRKKY